ncbi:hypothetical protein LCGC14_0695440 [marine sediment metagenome]|uniref:Bacteriophage T5 Orf172 DNA-binding domain-containing protein n=1 Tax=marine sediment metagenome TaxID=412755 RepID=A0A0F9R4K1_9ZZZZ|nr:MAG: T5orf172 domain-containing protein [Candidatus Lokiarchaeum sp. GC14_75]HEC38637.1 hypothetical protein [bacterium]
MYEGIICEKEHYDDEEIYRKHRRFGIDRVGEKPSDIIRVLRDSDSLEELYEKWNVYKMSNIKKNRNLFSTRSFFGYKYGYVYFIQGLNGGLIKIGYSMNPEKRFKKIQDNSPINLRIICYIKGGRAKETKLHRKFRDERQHSEWFEPSERLLEYINSCNR